MTAVSGGSTIAWTYDSNGNTATKTTGGVTYTYSYDRENRLVDVSTTSGSIFSAVYDYRSRRLEKTENSSTVKYLYDGGVSVQEYDGQGSLTKILVRGSGYGGGIGSVIYTADDTNGTNRRFFLYNALGSTSAMTNDAMTVTSTSSYDGWGKEVSSTGSSETDRKFCTKERSASIGLDYFGFRYYDYDLGRFTTRDPSGYPDGLNNYLYCSNDPVNKIDPLGLREKTSQEEKNIQKLKDLEEFAINNAKATKNKDKKQEYNSFANNIKDYRKDYEKEIDKVKKGKKDPERLKAQNKALTIWSSEKENNKYNRESGKEQDTEVSGFTKLSKDISITCNYFVAEVKQYSTEENLGKTSWRFRTYPPVANDWGNEKSTDSRMRNFPVTKKPEPGDVVAFPVKGDSGHVGIYLGHDLYVSSRTGDTVGTYGKGDKVQPHSGVQIKKLPKEKDRRRVFREYKKTK